MFGNLARPHFAESASDCYVDCRWSENWSKVNNCEVWTFDVDRKLCHMKNLSDVRCYKQVNFYSDLDLEENFISGSARKNSAPVPCPVYSIKGKNYLTGNFPLPDDIGCFTKSTGMVRDKKITSLGK